jgi:EpsI family protein
MPMVFDGWRGRAERDFAPEIVKVLGVDDYITRSYYGADGGRMGLYVGYHSSQRQGDTIHSPLNCLPGAGWLPIEQGRVTLTVADPALGGTRQIEVNRVLIERGLDRQLVLYWYQSHGRVVASEYWGKIYTVVDAIRLNRTEAALVRVVAPIPSRDAEDVAAADKAAKAFVQELFPHLGRHLPS